ncbi:MAG: OB-fold domain-containing protein [Burkholderiales bacterium]
MNTAEGVLDWTTGTAGVAYQHCPACASNWAFRRTFCPRCGSVSPETRQASGDGVVYAVTTVTRAPTDEFRALAPYAIVLVDLAEGPRVMAHGVGGLSIGDRVRAGFIDVAGRVLPRFERA